MYFTNYLNQLVRDKMLAILANAKITFIIQLLYNIRIKLSFSSKTSLANESCLAKGYFTHQPLNL